MHGSTVDLLAAGVLLLCESPVFTSATINTDNTNTTKATTTTIESNDISTNPSNYMDDSFRLHYYSKKLDCCTIIPNLLSLTVLDLSNCSLYGSFPASFSLLSSLRELDISGNKINAGIEHLAFLKLRRLRGINVADAAGLEYLNSSVRSLPLRVYMHILHYITYMIYYIILYYNISPLSF